MLSLSESRNPIIKHCKGKHYFYNDKIILQLSLILYVNLTLINYTKPKNTNQIANVGKFSTGFVIFRTIVPNYISDLPTWCRNPKSFQYLPGTCFLAFIDEILAIIGRDAATMLAFLTRIHFLSSVLFFGVSLFPPSPLKT